MSACMLKVRDRLFPSVQGTTTGLLVGGLWAYSRKFQLHPRAKLAVNAMLGMVGVQASDGFLTLGMRLITADNG